jgi:hypothetical protein
MSSSSSSESSDTEPEVNDQKTIETQKMEIDEDSSDSSSEDEEVPPTPPPAPKKKKIKRIKPELIIPVKIPEGLRPSDSPVAKKHKKHKKKHKKDKRHEETPVQECDPIEQPVKKKRKKTEMVTVPTSHPDVTVQVKKKKPGPRTQKIIVYEEDLPKTKYQIVHKSRKRGRPSSKSEVDVPETDQGIKIEEDQIVIDRPEKKKELSARQLKRMELDAKFVEMEAVAGRKLRQTKNGKVDKRCVKARSPAQIAASQRLAEFNKELRKQKKQAESKSAVKEVISELAVAQEMRKKEDNKKQEKQEEPQEQPIKSNEFSLFEY